MNYEDKRKALAEKINFLTNKRNEGLTCCEEHTLNKVREEIKLNDMLGSKFYQ